MKFDGRGFARIIEEDVKNKVRNFAKKPRVVSVLVGQNPASELYTRLKKQAAERVGIDFRIEKIEVISKKYFVKSIRNKVEETGMQEDVTGVMVQLPIAGLQGETLKEVVSAIPLTKDVDGLRYPESGVRPATVRAILSVLDNIAEDRRQKTGDSLWGQKFVVVGARGAVGTPLTQELKNRGTEVVEVEWDTENPEEKVRQGDVVISCVGKPGLVTGEMVSEGLIAIDVGMSKTEDGVVGDMTREVYEKASVSVEVPGGVGPVTIASLMANASDILVKL